MHDDHVAGEWPFRIQRLLHAQGAAVLAPDEARAVAVAGKGEAQAGVPGGGAWVVMQVVMYTIGHVC
jgi:hypothetical protein